MAVIQAGAFHRRNRVSNDFEQLTVDATVGGKALTGATYGASRYAEVVVETAPLRYTTDSTPPTATLGILTVPGDVIELESNEEIVAFRAIRMGSVSAVINCTYMDMKLTS